MKFELIPIYLRAANWLEEFCEKNRVVEKNDVNEIVIGDHKIRLGEEQLLPEELDDEFSTISSTNYIETNYIETVGD